MVKNVTLVLPLFIFLFSLCTLNIPGETSEVGCKSNILWDEWQRKLNELIKSLLRFIFVLFPFFRLKEKIFSYSPKRTE